MSGMAEKKNILTYEGLKQYEDELQDLKVNRRREVAQKIKEIARENHVEIVENKPLARMLYANVEIGQEVPPELYQSIAEVLAMVYKMQGKI